ncbi:LPXTG cell wall anchor domain-containing protein [Microbacterium aerolatum]|uniref:LPXTG cell wall anchor domain-containing protein n=1 Tax=Microbacterium aerolatum TaxID=153731 RepID=UPI0011BF8844|nr:LPXTG cell wall anchor domain-containing protein [Microbacterium aerolatum]
MTLTGAQSGAVTISFEVTGAAVSGGDASLASTGADSMPALSLGALLLLLGLGVALVARRRRV